jgi:glycosyltransferase involved in cell wall biosynthesis
LPTLSVGDAIGNEVMQIHDLLEGWGYKSEIFAENIHPQLRQKAKYYKYYQDSPDNILIYHYSIGSNITDFVKNLKSKIIIRYHNVTPPEFFDGVNEQFKMLCKKGRDDLKALNNVAVLSLANSEYSQLELDALEFKNIAVMPLIIDFNQYEGSDKDIIKQYDDEYKNLLFVGRILPQKKQEDVIKSYYYYKKYINPKSRLFLVGNYDSYREYYEQLQKSINKLRLNDVYFTNMVDFKQLLSYYKLADAFICMSDWESFCVPLVESMYFNIPIIAYNSTAIPSTLGNSGILVNKKRYEEIAELINCILENHELKDHIVRKENERLHEFEKENVSKILKQTIERIASGSVP